MLRARGLLAAIEAYPQFATIAKAAPVCTATAGWPIAARTAGPNFCNDDVDASAAAAGCRLHAAAAWSRRGVHTTAAAATTTDAATTAATTAAAATATAAASTVACPPAKRVLYRGRGMQMFRVLVRVKVFQLAGIAALAVPINTFLSTGSLATTQAVMAAALVVGAGVASGALWYYSRRYVGELSLLPGEGPGAPPRVRLSVLDFWGNREDNDIALQRLIAPLANLPLAAQHAALAEPLLPLDVEGDRQYFLSVRYGRVPDPKGLKALLTGQMAGQALEGDEAEEGGSNSGGSRSSEYSSSGNGSGSSSGGSSSSSKDHSSGAEAQVSGSSGNGGDGSSAGTGAS